MTCTKKGEFLCKIKETFAKIVKWFTTIFLVGFAWEVVEELIEDCIAYLITSMVARFVVKAISTAGVFGITQGAKTLIKKLLFPFIKTLTYKEGNDKMKFLKNYWTLVKGNKFTGLIPAIGFGLLSYYQTLWTFASGCWWFALIVALVFYNIAIFVGGETLTQILARIEEKTKNKELKAQLKKVQQAQAIVDKYEEAKKTIAEAPKN